jgi:hypothetical protein
VPELVGWTNQDLAVSGHRHACVHDQLDRPKHPVVEHRCECSMTWTERVEMPRTSKDVFIEYIEGRNADVARENRNNKRFSIFLVGGFTLVGLICIGALAGQGLGWWS